MAFRRFRKANVSYWTYNARTDYFYDIGLCVIARPAPRTPRPLAGVPNPYPYGCSVLCNHPKDPELKDVVWKPRHLAQDHSNGDHYDQNNRNSKKNNRIIGSSCENESFLYHHSWDETLSNQNVEGSPSTSQAAAHLTNIRRCTSSGPLNAERRLSKADSMLVLDLRPWKSFDNVSSVNDGHQDNNDNLERFELTSPPEDDKPGRARSTIKRPETFSSKSSKESKKTLRRSASSKSKESKATRQNNSSIPDANVVSDYDETSDCGINDDSRAQEIQEDLDQTSHTETLQVEKEISGETEEKYAQNEVQDRNMANQLDELEKTLRNIKIDGFTTQADNHQDNKNGYYPDLYQDMDWLNFPRAGQTFGARFELPIDLRRLKNMTAIEYLGLHVVATRCRQRLNDVVYERHAQGPSLPANRLLSGVAEILGFRLDQASEEKLLNLIQLQEDHQLTKEQFSGIGALAERIGRAEISEKDDLEISDFNLLKQKLTYLQMSSELHHLFLFICQDI